MAVSSCGVAAEFRVITPVGSNHYLTLVMDTPQDLWSSSTVPYAAAMFAVQGVERVE